MFKTRTFVALGLLGAVAAALLWSRSRPDKYAAKPGVAGAPAGAPAAVKPEDVDRLEIAEPGKAAVILVRDGAGPAWKLVEPVADAADPRAVEAALKVLGELSWKQVVAESVESHQKLAVRDEDAVKVVAKRGDTALVSLLIGKTGQVRLVGQNAVWQVGKLNRQAFLKEPKMWRFREVLRVEKSAIDRLEVSVAGEGGGKVVVKREAPPAPAAGAADAGVPAAPPAADRWILVEGAEAVGGALDETVPGSVAAALGRLDVAEFADGVSAESAGLVPPRAVAAVVLTDGTRKAVEIGKDDGDFVFARVEGTPRVFKLRKSAGETLGKAPLQWRDKVLAKVDGKDVVKVELDKGGQKLVFTRDPAAPDPAAAWTAVPPASVPELDPARVQGVAAGFASLRAQTVSPLAAADPKTGFVKPTGRVRLYTASGLALDLTIGALVEHSYFVRVAGRPEVFTVADSMAGRWLKGPEDLKKSPPPAPGLDPHAH